MLSEIRTVRAFMKRLSALAQKKRYPPSPTGGQLERMRLGMTGGQGDCYRTDVENMEYAALLRILHNVTTQLSELHTRLIMAKHTVIGSAVMDRIVYDCDLERRAAYDDQPPTLMTRSGDEFTGGRNEAGMPIVRGPQDRHPSPDQLAEYAREITGDETFSRDMVRRRLTAANEVLTEAIGKAQSAEGVDIASSWLH